VLIVRIVFTEVKVGIYVSRWKSEKMRGKRGGWKESRISTSTYHISAPRWGFSILATAAFMRALRVRLTE
jgi:hypothetical protein